MLLLFDLPVENGILLLVGVLILLFTVFRMGRRRRQRLVEGFGAEADSARATGREPWTTQRQPVDANPEELQKLIVDLQEIGREIEAKLETKIRYANQLFKEADRATSDLNGAIQRARSTLTELEQKLPRELDDLFDLGEDQGPSQGAETADAGEPDRAEDPSQTDAKTQTDSVPADLEIPSEVSEVLELSRAGYDAESIAARTGQPVGEVRLVLSVESVRKRGGR